jgi:hypothetical protein
VQDQVTLESIGAGIARIDERTKGMLKRMDQQNGKVDNIDARVDAHDVQISGISLKQKIYLSLSGIGVAGAAGHDKIASLFAALFG